MNKILKGNKKMETTTKTELINQLRNAWRRNTIYDYFKEQASETRFKRVLNIKEKPGNVWDVELMTYSQYGELYGIPLVGKNSYYSEWEKFEFDDDSDNPNNWRLANQTYYNY